MAEDSLDFSGIVKESWVQFDHVVDVCFDHFQLKLNRSVMSIYASTCLALLRVTSDTSHRVCRLLTVNLDLSCPAKR